MDDARFDDLARSLGSASRRSLLRRLAGAAFLGAEPALGDATAASARNARKRCKKLKGKKKQKCLRRARDAQRVDPQPPAMEPDPCEAARCVDEGPASCGTTGVCAAGACLMYNPGTPCRSASCENGVETLAATCDGRGTCPLVQNDCGAAGCGPAACKGANGARCGVGEECVSAHCVGGFCCNKACVGEHASTPGFCDYGVCILVCDSGWGNCDGPAPGACDTPLGTDTDCRYCDDPCPFDTFCEGAQCVPQFDTGHTCTRDRQCVSDWCISGVCCDQNCLPDKCPTGMCRP